MYIDDIFRNTLVALKALDEKSEPELGPCDTCGERPGDRIATEARISVCAECDEAEYRQMRRLPRFRNRDERDAYEAGVRARGEI